MGVSWGLWSVLWTVGLGAGVSGALGQQAVGLPFRWWGAGECGECRCQSGSWYLNGDPSHPCPITLDPSPPIMYFAVEQINCWLSLMDVVDGSFTGTRLPVAWGF